MFKRKVMVLLVSFTVFLMATGTTYATESDSEKNIVDILSNRAAVSDDGIVHINIQTVDALTAGAAGSWEKDLITGEVKYNTPVSAKEQGIQPSPAYQPANLPIEPRTVIGTDEREAVLNPKGPYYNHCALLTTFPDGSTRLYTGFMIGPDALATAGHSIYMHDRGGWATSVKVIPGASDGNHPVGSYHAIGYSIGGEWGSSANSFDDWGFIRLNDDAGLRTGWLGKGGWTTDFVVGKACTVAGYPGDLQEERPFEDVVMYAGSGKIQGIRVKALPSITHSVDTSGGQSGAPVFGFMEEYGYTAFAIHAYGAGSSGYNSAVLINDWLYGAMRKYVD